MELSLATHIPVSDWLAQGDDVLATVMDIYEKRNRATAAAERKAKRKGSR